jgi:PAS domain S-box-containing protein
MKIPLRLILVVPFVLQISVSVGLTGWLSWRNGQEAVNNVASQLRREISDRIQERLQVYLASAHQANRITVDAIELGQLNPQDTRSLERHLWKNIQAFPTLNLLYFGDRQGNNTGVGRNTDGSVFISVSASGKLNRYQSDSKGDRTNLIKVSVSNYDSRSRPWFKAAIAANKPTWTEVYADFFSRDSTITAAQPTYDASGNFLGVIGSDLIFAQANEFLRGLKIGQSGQTFIIERSGMLIAASTLDPLVSLKGDRMERMMSTESSNIQIREASKYLESLLGGFSKNLSMIDMPMQLDFVSASGKQFLQVTPLKDGKGIDWLIVTVIPESDFLSKIYDNNRSTALLCLTALMVSVVAGVAIAHSISKSIQPLIQASQKIADGDLSMLVPVDHRIGEFGALSQSFNKMTENLCEAFTELQESNAYLNTIINNLSNALLVVDLNHRIGFVNQSLISMFGLDATNLVGRDYHELFDSDIISLIGQTQKNRNIAFTAEISLPDKRIGQAAAAAIRIIQTQADECLEQGCIGYMIMIRDVTSEKEVDRLKTEFLSNISHELRTPLVSILGFSKIVEKKFEDAVTPLIPTDDKKAQRSVKQIRDNLGIILSESQHLTAIINNVLDITNLESDRVAWNMQPLALNQVFKDAISNTAHLFLPKELAVITDLDESLPEVTADKDRISQVMHHLLTNAAKFTDSGSVTCTSKYDSANQQITISVADTGIGIDSDDHENVFEKFKQVGDILTDKPHGTGLGLPIAKAIITKHGGKIWFESEPGKGSTFSFSLPVNA